MLEPIAMLELNCIVIDFCCMIIGCSLMELWNLSTTNTTFLRDVSLLDDAVQYHSCVTGSVGSVALKDIRLSTSTVAYYTGITPGSKACYVCDENSGYDPNTTTNERICQSDATWSESPITCGMYLPQTWCLTQTAALQPHCIFITLTKLVLANLTAILQLLPIVWVTIFPFCIQVHKIRKPLKFWFQLLWFFIH